MLKKIPATEATLGMYLQSLEGSWLSHPFWKTKFVIRDREDLQKLQNSAITEVWIDPDKGLDIAGKAGDPVLAAARHEPGVVPYLIPAHRSREVGHRRVLEALGGAAPLALLDLDLALGEASGALLAFPLLELALATHAEMTTFDGAGVPDREPESPSP